MEDMPRCVKALVIYLFIVAAIFGSVGLLALTLGQTGWAIALLALAALNGGAGWAIMR